MSEDATTSQVASTCLQIEYDCIVVLLFCFCLFCFFPLGGVEYSSEVPDLMNRVCVCVRILCTGRCEFYRWRGRFLGCGREGGREGEGRGCV